MKYTTAAAFRQALEEQFLVDIGFSDTISWTPDTIYTSRSLAFAGIAPLALPAIPIPQHLAEKVHAYTRTYGQSRKPSTRPRTSSTYC